MTPTEFQSSVERLQALRIIPEGYGWKTSLAILLGTTRQNIDRMAKEGTKSMQTDLAITALAAGIGTHDRIYKPETKRHLARVQELLNSFGDLPKPSVMEDGTVVGDVIPQAGYGTELQLWLGDPATDGFDISAEKTLANLWDMALGFEESARYPVRNSFAYGKIPKDWLERSIEVQRVASAVLAEIALARLAQRSN